MTTKYLTIKKEILICWKNIKNYEGYYTINNNGNVKSIPRYVKNGNGGNIWTKERILKQGTKRSSGYPYVELCKHNKRKKYMIHNLVLETFIGERPKNMEACHCNGIKTDNRLCNLRWDTKENNEKDKIKHGTLKSGSSHPKSKFNNNDIYKILSMYKKGKTKSEIAKIYKVNESTIRRICNGNTYKSSFNLEEVKEE